MSRFSKTIKNSLVLEVRDEIVRGSYAPGEWLRLEALAERFEVSTMPIREALSVLEAEGIVKIHPHKGAQVTSFSPAELLEIYEMRAILERHATIKAVPRMTGESIATLERINSEVSELRETFDFASFARLNMEFHTQLYANSGQTHLCATIRTLRSRVQHYLHKYVESTHNVLVREPDHHRIVEFARSGNALEAAEVVYQHVYSAGVYISRLMLDEENLQTPESLQVSSLSF
jgi:DNA-binding GntR family transcriptional regulator